MRHLFQFAPLALSEHAAAAAATALAVTLSELVKGRYPDQLPVRMGNSVIVDRREQDAAANPQTSDPPK
jgi:hypothetical protein